MNICNYRKNELGLVGTLNAVIGKFARFVNKFGEDVKFIKGVGLTETALRFDSTYRVPVQVYIEVPYRIGKDKYWFEYLKWVPFPTFFIWRLEK